MKIKSIKQTEKKFTVDIEVENTHSYQLKNGCVVHNTTSCVLGTSSGIHAWHNDYFIRRQRLGKNEALYTYLSIYHPELLEDDYFRPETQAIVMIPCKAPEGSIVRTENVFNLLERVKQFNIDWVKEGHRSGDNVNNVSATVSIKKIVDITETLDENNKKSFVPLKDADSEVVYKVNEWPEVGEWMWNNREFYSGISVLPYDNGSYVQAPFTDCTKEEYENLVSKILTGVDLTKCIEMVDETNLMDQAACAGGACEIV